MFSFRSASNIPWHYHKYPLTVVSYIICNHCASVYKVRERDTESKLNEWRTNSRNLPSNKTSIHHSYLHLVEVNGTVCTFCTLTHDSQQCVWICVCVMFAWADTDVIPLFNLCHCNRASGSSKRSEINRQSMNLFRQKATHFLGALHLFLQCWDICKRNL
jgi:hypothetical protein